MSRRSRMPVPPSVEDCERFQRCCVPHLSALLRTARCLVSGMVDAEDLVQDTMLKALEAMASFRDGTNAKAWLMTILRRTFIDRLRSRRQRPAAVALHPNLGDDLACPPSEFSTILPSDPDSLLERFSDSRIIDALRALPPLIRWTLLLVDVEDLGQEQAAAILGIPVGTVKSRAHRGRRMLYELLLPESMPRASGQVGVREVLRNHTVGGEKRSVDRDRVTHDVDPGVGARSVQPAYRNCQLVV